MTALPDVLYEQRDIEIGTLFSYANKYGFISLSYLTESHIYRGSTTRHI